MLRAAGLSVFAIMGLIALSCCCAARTRCAPPGWSFLTEQAWQTRRHRFGIAAVLPDGVLIALVALVIAVPLALGAALFISEYAPAAAAAGRWSRWST